MNGRPGLPGRKGEQVWPMSVVEKWALLSYMHVFFIYRHVFCDFQGEVGAAGAPGIPGKEGLVGPKVFAVYLVFGVQM